MTRAEYIRLAATLPTIPALRETLVPLTFHLTTKAKIGPAVVSSTELDIRNNFSPLMRSGTEGRESDMLSFGSVLSGQSNTAGSRGSRGRELMSLTPEILHMLNCLEPDKGKMTRLLTDHLTGQRLLPFTEHEL